MEGPMTIEEIKTTLEGMAHLLDAMQKTLEGCEGDMAEVAMIAVGNACGAVDIASIALAKL